MSDFWGNADGDASKAFVNGFSPIPEGTFLACALEDAVFSEGFGPQYDLKWRVITGEFSNRLVFQKIKAFDSDQAKAEKARNMLLLLFKLFKVSAPKDAPVDADFRGMIGQMATLKMGHWEQDGKSGNFVREVHDSGDVKPEGSHIPSAFSRNQNAVKIPAQDDIPF